MMKTMMMLRMMIMMMTMMMMMITNDYSEEQVMEPDSVKRLASVYKWVYDQLDSYNYTNWFLFLLLLFSSGFLIS